LKTKENLRLHARCWEPEDEAQGVLCLVHGLGEHSGRYAHFADYLNRAGYAVLSFDLRGHGLSEGQRGHSPSFDTFMDDVGMLLEEAGRRFEGLPCFLYGHSLGGLLVLNYVLRRRPELAGVIATGPGLRTSLTRQTAKIAFVQAAGELLPQFSLSTGLHPESISRDSSVVQAYRDDPLVHQVSTLRMAKTTLQSIPWAFEHASEFDAPLLLMHGTADQLTYPEGTQEFAQKVFCECTVKLWEGLYHEIHNEPEKDEVFAYTVDWMREHTSR
jgi:alpha-beta hydrolase superfamily lysophospholipase